METTSYNISSCKGWAILFAIPRRTEWVTIISMVTIGVFLPALKCDTKKLHYWVTKTIQGSDHRYHQGKLKPIAFWRPNFWGRLQILFYHLSAVFWKWHSLELMLLLSFAYTLDLITPIGKLMFWRITQYYTTIIFMRFLPYLFCTSGEEVLVKCLPDNNIARTQTKY